MKSAEILFTLIATILTAVVAAKWKTINRLGKLTLIVVIIAAALAAYNGCKQNKKERLIERIQARFGEINDLHGASIPKICSGKCQGNGMPISPNGLLFFDQTGPLFRVYVKNNKLFADAVIRDSDAIPIAVIDGNEWTVFSDQYEYNNDETGFEMVTKGDREVFFQIYLEDGIAHILGILINEQGNGVKFAEGVNEKPGSEDTETLLFQMILPNAPIKKMTVTEKSTDPIPDAEIFRYPREKYIGVRK